MDEGESGNQDENEKDKGRAGKGSGGGGIRLPPNKLKEVMEVWRDFDAIKIIEQLAEFASDGPFRASANAEVSWPKANLQDRGFAIVNQFLDVVHDLHDFIRDPSRKANADRLRRKLGFVPTSIVPTG